MKDKIDFSLVKTLLGKQRDERRSAYRKGNFDAVGFFLRLILVALFVAVFVIFFGRFMSIYFSIRTRGLLNVRDRLYEALTVSYMVIVISLTVGGVGSMIRELFLADDIKLFSAMPVGPRSLFVAKLISIYRKQLLLSIVTVLAVNITVYLNVPAEAMGYLMPKGPWFYWGMTVLFCFVLPMVSIAIASLLALPYYAIRQFLQNRYALMFIIVTALTALAFYAYAVVLGAVKEMLLGDDLKYFFNESVMHGIGVAVYYLVPGKWLARFLLNRGMLENGLLMLAVLIVCAVIALLIIRSIMVRALQARISGGAHFMYPKRYIGDPRPQFGALIRKEFVQIFRTPSYMFSYFSIAVIMPLMVYFCMEVASSLVTKLIGYNFNLELALFLTLLFSALTNVFCSTNISREGPMFYSVKALPVSYRQVISSKIVFCLFVSLASEFITAVVLFGAGYVPVSAAAFVFLIGVVFSFAQICFATRYDFNHARFSTEDDGEIKESGSTVSTIIVLGMLLAFLIGGSVLLIKLLYTLRSAGASSAGYLTYAIVGGITLVATALSCFYLVFRLRRKYYEFSGGGLM